ncbi:hypothetical protein GEMRC1_001155 [Eukaryota sp. GEM-RC1]
MELLKVNIAIINNYFLYCFIRDEGARVLADALVINTTLTNIDLSQNSIGEEGARVLAKVLKVNSTVASINLSQNCIGPKGVRILTAFKVNVLNYRNQHHVHCLRETWSSTHFVKYCNRISR